MSMKREKGFSLIEVIVALALLGMVAVSFLGALAGGSNAIFIADERATGESLARTEMEYIRNQDYSPAPWAYELPSGAPPADPPTWWDPANPHTLPQGYDNYAANINAEPLHDTDDGIQEITVVIKHLGKEIFILEGYRSLR
jgi:prepilin-type N-terminal cleavage/methylation domain-containing protein